MTTREILIPLQFICIWKLFSLYAIGFVIRYMYKTLHIIDQVISKQ